MQILKPIVHETIWGGKKLTPFTDGSCKSIGHLYSFVDNKSMQSLIEEGTYSGKTIHDWFLDNKKKYGLGEYSELPILAALVEARATLSIQVHPDDCAARKIEGLAFGKNESFYALEAPAGGFMYNGCKVESIRELREALQGGNVLDVVDIVPCEVGDYIYIEGGTLHAATEGSLLFEVEENCDRTYRVYDFDRRGRDGKTRELQTELALECINVGKRSITRKYDNGPIEERMYSTQLVRNESVFENKSEMFAFAVMIRGAAELNGVSILPGRATLLESGDSINVTGSEYIIVWPKIQAIQDY